MNPKPLKILYICTHNRCRSILSEAITRQLGEGLLDARSAGSAPAGQVHPLSLHYLQQAGFNTEGLYSKSWDDMESFAPDLVITVCDAAAGESCPLYFGRSVKAHWPLQDPSRISSSEEEQGQAFGNCIGKIRERLALLLEAYRNGELATPDSLREWLQLQTG